MKKNNIIKDIEYILNFYNVKYKYMPQNGLTLRIYYIVSYSWVRHAYVPFGIGTILKERLYEIFNLLTLMDTECTTT